MTKDDLPLLPSNWMWDESFIYDAEGDAIPAKEYMQGYALAAIAAHDSQAARERDIAEDALLRRGYRKSCDIPACNCGDQWTHGGHANARLYEVSEALMQADCRRNGETILADVVHVCAENERLKAIAAHDAKREKVLMRKHKMTGAWDEEKFPSAMRSSNYSYHWAYIEREGA